MMKHYSYLNTADVILAGYNGTQPFALFIKNFFKADKKYGSKDRKRITALCYAYFRLGKVMSGASIRERILLGLYLTSTQPDELLELERPGWNEHYALPVEEKLVLAGSSFSPGELFPGITSVSSQIDPQRFALSHFIQPDLFLRIRPGYEEKVKRQLSDAGIIFKEVNEHCLALPNASKLDEVVVINREVVIQDSSSQQVIEVLNADPAFLPWKVWDCCAASGGKSLLVYDRFPRIQLTVSDVRENILANLARRFRDAGIRHYSSFVADLSRPLRNEETYDLIVADVPCTGSGTWGRTPEQLVFFGLDKIAEYARRQRQIITNTWRHLKPGGMFLYITCSVYREENEEAVAFAEQYTALKLVTSALIQGYEQKADTLFAAVFRKEE